MMIFDGMSLREHELGDLEAVLTEVGTYTAGDLGLSTVRGPMLTPDGLHMVFIGSNKDDVEGMYYADRAELTARFSVARLLDGVPVNDGAYVPDDCSRIYLSGLGSVFYAPRI
jgi:hypothetical protein